MSWRPGFDPEARPHPESRLLALAANRVVVTSAEHADGEPLHVGSLDGEEVFAARLSGAPPADAPTLRGLLAEGPADLAQAAGRAAQLLAWEATHRFCGSCGAANARSPEELVRVCPGCGAATYPRISPAVIMAVRRDEELLLVRRAGSTSFWSVLAGFVEPGETLEQAVVREVAEEAGIDVVDVRYEGSQPWPFPSQLMIGFTARYAGGELRVDETELAEARWFAPDELPTIPPPFTIANRLILGGS